jgi:AcrR family transcriptional regulator
MEAIAREAGVGVGTLYRHFPRRIDVVEAVYREDVDEVVRSAEQAVAEHEPWPAVEAFLAAYVAYAERKRTLLDELREAFAKSPDLKLQARLRLEQAMSLVIERGQRAGVVRPGVDGADLFQLLGPVCTDASLSEERRRRLLAMILDGLRSPLAAPSSTR